MVENTKVCVLQWAGHAGYVTGKFSELLARQAFVDVTLVCEEQKLRVHKLVLASNSKYFEEILQEDLGQEPIIFLKDLNFEILKAMVEFMYCGETTIPHQLVSPLLSATKIFKVKELATVVEAMMTSSVEKMPTNTNIDREVSESNINSIKSSNTDCIHTKCNELIKDECFLLCNQSNSDVNPSENQSLESNTITDAPGPESEHTLYEESQDLEINIGGNKTIIPVSSPIRQNESKNSTAPTNCSIAKVSNVCSEDSVIDDNVMCTKLTPILYEQCCDFSDIDEYEENSMPLSRSCLQQIEKDFAQYTFEGIDVPSKVGKCVKVYSHKRRKSIDEIKNKLTDVNNIMQNQTSTDCIDLLDEPSTNDIPVTLLTSLDMESAEYIISLSTENIQSIVGATLNEQHTLNSCKKFKHINEYDNAEDGANKKELNTNQSESSKCMKPILRRSLRLNQQEIEETVNNNETTTEKEKHSKRSSSPNKTELFSKRKRKIKDTDRKVPEQNVTSTIQSAKKTFNNSRKNTSKLIVKKCNKSACVLSNKEKDEQTIKVTNKLKYDSPEKLREDDIFTSPASNTIEHINRALWGDMSDFPEDCRNRMNLLEYTPNTEIPFAVGLLPLRTALEKMQATPDYQPRKTRSSVAPIKQDASNLKRKNLNCLSNISVSKKQNSCINDPKENAKTVCHIQIRTAPSQYVRNRKKYISSDITALEPPSIINKQ